MEQNRPSIADVERAHLESLARLDPTQTLQKLEVAMNLSNFEDYVSYASPSTPSPLSMLISPSSPTSRTATTSLLPTPRDELWKIPEEELTVLLMKGLYRLYITFNYLKQYQEQGIQCIHTSK